MTQTPFDDPAEPTTLRELMKRRDYVLFWIGRVGATLGVQIQSVALGWQMYAVARETMDVKQSAFYVGMIGLADALSRFDAAQGVQFETFATQRIRGAMLDELRGNDYLSRGTRKQQRTIESAVHKLEQKLGRAPVESEIAREMGTTLAEYQADMGVINKDGSQIYKYLNFDKIETVGTSDEIPVLVLPVGKRIEFEQASADVIHSFWVPEFLFKRDVFPDPKSNHSENVWQVSEITETGAFVGRCAEMCGTYHAMMNFEIRAISKEDFQRYIALRANEKLSNAAALEAICQQPKSVTTVPFETRRRTGGKTPKHLGDTWQTQLPNCTPRVTGAS